MVTSSILPSLPEYSLFIASWGGMELTIPLDTKDTSQTRAFMKEISTDGNVNTLADLVPKALPALYYLAPEYIRLLLQPMMEYALIWPANFAFHDLGKSMYCAGVYFVRE